MKTILPIRTDAVRHTLARPFLVLLAGVALLFLTGCSSAPKRAVEVVARKNEAAEYSKLADDYFFKGQYLLALQFYGEALDANLSVDNREGAIVARNSLGRAHLALGRMDDALREFSDALQDARSLGLSALVAQALSNLGEYWYARGELAQADAYLLEAERLAPQSDAVWAVIAHNRGVVASARGDLEGAYALLLKAEQANDRARRWSVLGSNRYVLASVSNARGQLADAIAWAEKALQADKTAENSLGIGADLEALALLRRKAGEAAASFDLYRRAFGLWLSLGRTVEAERCLRALAPLADELGLDDYMRRYGRMLADIEGTRAR